MLRKKEYMTIQQFGFALPENQIKSIKFIVIFE